MKINYDKNLKLAGVGINPWSRLGPERWFSDYKIASLYEWDLDDASAPELLALGHDSAGELPRLNTGRLIQNKSFRQLANSRLDDYYGVTYKPVKKQDSQGLNINFINNQPAKSFENKLLFRRELAGLLPMPKFKVYDNKNLSLPELLAGRSAVVAQLPRSSGAKGTFIIKNQNDFDNFLELARPSGKVIVSEYIENAQERSIQACATKHGVFVGPLQKQMVNMPELVNAHVVTGRFCGGEISGSDKVAALYEQMAGYVKTIGQKIIESGYRGIFGVDFLISQNSNVYVLEVNQRITGMTPLATMSYRDGQDIPFYLLHILEQGNFEYEIADPTINQVPAIASMLILHNKKNRVGTLVRAPQSGSYRGQQHKKSVHKLKDLASGEYLLQRSVPIGAKINPGFITTVVFMPAKVLDDEDEITTEAKTLIDNLYKKTEVKTT